MSAAGLVSPGGLAAGEGDLRLFIGLRLSLAAAEAIGQVAADLRRAAGERGVAARWIAPAGFHITLGFLGWTRRIAVAAVRDRIGDALRGVGGFALRTGALGCFPGPERAQVLWVGIDDPGRRVADLAARIAAATLELGFAPAKRSYHPHLTLARLDPPADLRELLPSRPERLRSETWIDRVSLFESSIIKGVSNYSPQAEWLLEAAS